MPIHHLKAAAHSDSPRTPADPTLGYYAARGNRAAPEGVELDFVDQAVVEALPADPQDPRPPLPRSFRPFPSIGNRRLFVGPLREAARLPLRFVQPIICRKRGQDPADGFVGLDSRVLTEAPYGAPPPPRPVRSRAPSAPPRPRRPASPRAPTPPPSPPPLADEPLRVTPLQRALSWPMGTGASIAAQLPAAEGAARAPVRVAIIDFDFAGYGLLDPRRVDAAPRAQRLPANAPFPRVAQVGAADQAEPAHGYLMARVVQAAAPHALVGLFPLPNTDYSESYIRPTDLAAALAHAVAGWEADVVLIAMSDGLWGQPEHLRVMLRDAAVEGRAGRGAVLVCSSGRPDSSHDVDHTCLMLGADEFTSSPYVLAVGACDERGLLFRDHQGDAVSRTGPALELVGAGGSHSMPSGPGGADDSSLAAALCAGAVAQLLRRNPELHAAEVRAVLRCSTELPTAAGGGSFDRAGHSLQIGYGQVSALLCCLAGADPVAQALILARPQPAQRGGEALVRLALSWEAALQRLARPEGSLAREYLRLRGGLSRLCLRSLELRDALLWMARHLRELHLSADAERGDGYPIYDHGALRDRALHLLDALERELPHLGGVGGAAVPQGFVRRLRRALEGLSGEALHAFISGLQEHEERRGAAATAGVAAGAAC